MGLEIPGEVKWLLPIVVGESWPEGDEDKLRALRDAWHAASAAIPPAADIGNGGAGTVLSNWSGDGAKAFEEQWKKFTEGDEAYFKSITDACKALGDSCDQTALDVEYTKYMIIISLVILAAQIVAMLAAAFVTFGGSTAGVVPAQIATRMTVQAIFRQLLEKLAQQGFKQVAKELLETFLKKGLQEIAKEVGKNMAMNLAMDVGVQGLQVAKGDRKEWDWSKTGDSAVSGAVDGVIGAASGPIDKGVTSGLSHSAAGQVVDGAVRGAARGAVEGVASTVGQAAVTGDLDKLSAKDVLMGASGGAVDGGVGGGKDRIGEIKAHNGTHADPATPGDGGSGSGHGGSGSGGNGGSGPRAGGSTGSGDGGGQGGQGGSDHAGSGDARSSHGEPSTARSAPATQPSPAPESHAASAPNQADGAPTGHADTDTTRATTAQAQQPVADQSPAGGQQPAAAQPGPQPAAPPNGGAATPVPGSSPGSQGGFGMAPPPQHSGGPSGFGPSGSGVPAGYGPTGSGGPSGYGPTGSGGQAGYGPTGSGGQPGSSPTGPGRQPGFGPTGSGGPAGYGPIGSGGGSPHGFGPTGAPAQQGRPHDAVNAAGFVPGGVHRPESAPPPRAEGVTGHPGAPHAAGAPGGYGPPPMPGAHPGGGGRPGGPHPAGHPQQGPAGPQGRPPRQPAPPQARDPRRTGYPGQGQAPRQAPPAHQPPPGDPRRAAPPPQQRPHTFGPGQPGPVMPPPHPSAPPRAGLGGPPPQPNHPQHPNRPPEPSTPPRGYRGTLGEPAMPQRHSGTLEPETTTQRPAESPQPSERPTPAHQAPETGPRHEPAPAPPPEPRYPDTDGPRTDRHADVDQSCLTDPDYRTTARENFDELGETQLDSRLIQDNGELRHEQVYRDAIALRDADRAFAHLSDDGAYAVHSYTRHEVFLELNEALRTGNDRLPELVKQARAVISGLNELPVFEGETVRNVNHHGNQMLIAATADHYEPGKIIVETQFNSSARSTPELPDSPFPGEVELRVRSKTGRDISDLASRKVEREVLHKPGTQLLVTERKLGVDPKHGWPKWFITAEEIAPGDPRHLDSDTAQRQMEHRRHEQGELEKIAHAQQQGRMSSVLNPLDKHTEATGTRESSTSPERPPAIDEPDGGWRELSRATNPPSEAAIHAGTAETPQQQVRFLRSELPEVGGVNVRNFYSPDAIAGGYRTNAANAVVALERHLGGDREPATPITADQVTYRGSLDHVRRELGGQWSHHADFDGAIRQLAGQPIGSRAVLAYACHEQPEPGAEPGTPQSQPRVVNRLVTAVQTEHGLALVDPTSGRLATLGHPPLDVQVLPYHHGEGPAVAHDAPQAPAAGEHTPQEHHPAAEPTAEPAAEPAELPTTAERLNPPEPVPDLGEDYLFDPEHRTDEAGARAIEAQLGEHAGDAREKALRLRSESPRLAHMSDAGAIAVHSYTRSEVAYDANAAHRMGPEHPDFAVHREHVKAIVGGLNELPPLEAELVRGIDYQGDHRRAELTAAHYEVGQITVEPTLTSASIKTADAVTTKFGDDVQIHIQSRTSRDISELAVNPGEREALSKPGTQLLVHQKELEIDPGTGRRRWVIRAEEIAPGDSRHLAAEAVQQKLAERHARHAAEAPEFAQRQKSTLCERLEGDTTHQPPAEQAPRPDISGRLDNADGFAGDARNGPEHVPAAAEQAGDHDWSPLARATDPPGEPAIHADTATPNQSAKYIAERHPELAAVNPHFNDPDAFTNGYLTNCTRGVVAYAQRLVGIEARAEALLPAEMPTKGTLQFVQERLGGQWSDHADYDSVIRTMRDRPIGDHAVVGVRYTGPDGQVYGHVAMAVHTSEGVAFIDPQSGSLMHLPHPPVSLHLLPFGSLHGGEGSAAPHRAKAADGPAEPLKADRTGAEAVPRPRDTPAGTAPHPRTDTPPGHPAHQDGAHSEAEPMDVDTDHGHPMEIDSGQQPMDVESGHPEPVHPDSSHTEPADPEPGHREPAHPGQGRPEPSHPEPAHHKPVHHEPSHAESAHPAPVRPEPGHVEPHQHEPDHHQPSETEPVHTEPFPVEPHYPEPMDLDPADPLSHAGYDVQPSRIGPDGRPVPVVSRAVDLPEPAPEHRTAAGYGTERPFPERHDEPGGAREQTSPTHATPAQAGPGPEPQHHPERGQDGGAGEPRPWPADPGNGVPLRPRDLRFLGLTEEQIDWWRTGAAPLGMTPEQFGRFQSSLADVLAPHGVRPEDVQIRLVGSSVRIYSGWNKRMDNIPDHTPESLERLRDWFGDDTDLPERRPFDTMYKLGLSDKPSDYDVSFHSDRMVQIAREHWLATGGDGEFSHRYGFVHKHLFAEAFPELLDWSERWQDELGRKVGRMLFGLEEEPLQRRSANAAVHDESWPLELHRDEETASHGEPELRPWPADPANGYRLRERDLRFLGITDEQVHWWRTGRAPMGMTPIQFRDFRSSLLDALREDGVDAEDVDIRLKGSGVNMFSNKRKALPELDGPELDGNPEAAARMREWLGDDSRRPHSRPFDSMHRLGLSGEPSDYDVQVRSDQMSRMARELFEDSPPAQVETFAHEKYRFVNKDVMNARFPALLAWAERWSAEFGRDVDPALFGLEGEPRQANHDDPEKAKRGWPIAGPDAPPLDRHPHAPDAPAEGGFGAAPEPPPAAEKHGVAELDPDSPVLTQAPERPPVPEGAGAQDATAPPALGADGSWHWKGLTLDPRQNAVTDALLPGLRDAAHGEGGIRAQMLQIQERVASTRLEGLEYDVKSGERLKEKVADTLLEELDIDAEEALAGVGDGIRYTFAFDTADYSAGVARVEAELRGLGHEQVKFKNFWTNEDNDYQGINTQWRDHRTGFRFEVQYHTPESWHVKSETHDAYEHINNPLTRAEQSTAWARYQRTFFELVPVPPGVGGLGREGTP